MVKTKSTGRPDLPGLDTGYVPLCEAVTWLAVGVPWNKERYAVWAVDAYRREKQLAVANARPLTDQEKKVVGDLDELKRRVRAEIDFTKRLYRYGQKIIAAIRIGDLHAMATSEIWEGDVKIDQRLVENHSLGVHLAANQIVHQDPSSRDEAKPYEATHMAFHGFSRVRVERGELIELAEALEVREIPIDAETGLVLLPDLLKAGDPAALERGLDHVELRKAIFWLATGELWTPEQFEDFYGRAGEAAVWYKTGYLYHGGPANDQDIACLREFLQRVGAVNEAIAEAQIDLMQAIKGGHLMLVAYPDGGDREFGPKDLRNLPLKLDVWADPPLLANHEAEEDQRRAANTFIPQNGKLYVQVEDLLNLHPDTPQSTDGQRPEQVKILNTRREAKAWLLNTIDRVKSENGGAWIVPKPEVSRLMSERFGLKPTAFREIWAEVGRVHKDILEKGRKAGGNYKLD